MDDWLVQLPLEHAWERAAAKELSQILYGICSGGFDSPQALVERLSDAAESIGMAYCGSGADISTRVAVPDQESLLDWLREG